MGATMVETVTLRRDADYIYKFPVCFLCMQNTPFLVYLDDNQKAKKFRPLPHGIQMYCPTCAPEPDHYSRQNSGEKIYCDESILNDRKLINLLAAFCYGDPKTKGFWELDRIIITEKTRLCEPYKKVANMLAKTALPKTCKIEKLMNLFPPWHRMANAEFENYKAMRTAVRRKVDDIKDNYMNLSEAEHNQMQDNIDTLVDRTPMHARMTSQRALMPPPMTPPAADVTASSLGDLSVSSSVAFDQLRSNNTSGDDRSMSQDTQERSHASQIQPSSQSLVLSSQSVQLSTQDISDPNGNFVRTPSIVSMSSESSDLSQVSTAGQGSPKSGVAHRSKRPLEDSSSESEEERRRTRSLSVASRSAPPTPNDGQIAGPSHKRQRHVLPMNPSPEEFARNPSARMPRLLGA